MGNRKNLTAWAGWALEVEDVEALHGGKNSGPDRANFRDQSRRTSGQGKVRSVSVVSSVKSVTAPMNFSEAYMVGSIKTRVVTDPSGARKNSHIFLTFTPPTVPYLLYLLTYSATLFPAQPHIVNEEPVAIVESSGDRG